MKYLEGRKECKRETVARKHPHTFLVSLVPFQKLGWVELACFGRGPNIEIKNEIEQNKTKAPTPPPAFWIRNYNSLFLIQE